MDSYEYNELLKELKNRVNNIETILSPEKLNLRLKEIELIEQETEFWNDIQRAKEIQKEKIELYQK